MNERPSLADRWRALRHRLIASPRFQAFAARFPLTRPIARREARALFDIVAGFVYSQILFACVKLGLFRLLAEGPLSTDEIARRVGLPPDGALRLLRAAASLRLVEKRGGDRWGLDDLGAALLGNPGVEAMIEHHSLLYADLADPLPLLRGEVAETALSRFWGYARSPDPAGLGGGEAAPYSALMTASQHLVAADILASHAFGRHRRHLDIGGGEGGFAIALARAHQGLSVTVADLPAVAAAARQRIAAAGLSERIVATGVDATRELPGGFDSASLVRVLHDHDDEAAQAMLAAARRALTTGGTLIVAEPMAEAPGAAAMGDAYFGFYLLAMRQGRPRPAAEIVAMLERAGFVEVRVRPTPRPMLTGLVVGRAP